MRILFYFVHPAKYHLFRYVIKEAKKHHSVDIVINSKNVLEELIRKENWDVVNIFPNGRNIAKTPSVILSALKFLLTIFRLEKYLLSRDKYDLFITDDALVVNGWYRKIFSMIFNDNDIETIKFNRILFYFADKIIAPESVDLGLFKNKRLSFKGNKALAHLHPDVFKPDPTILPLYGLEENTFSIIRVSKINATHDLGNEGIDDSYLEDLFEIFSLDGAVLLSTEREIKSKYDKYIFKGDPEHMSHLIYFSRVFVGDSSTMASEAAILGTPNILINKLSKYLAVNRELCTCGLHLYYDNYLEARSSIIEILKDKSLKPKLRESSLEYIKNCDNFNVWFLSIIQEFKPVKKSYLETIFGK